MKQELEIKGIFSKQKLSISKNKLHIEKNVGLSLKEYDIHLENIQDNIVIKSGINRDFFAVAISIFFIGLIFNMADGVTIFMFSILLSLIVFVSAFFTRKRTITINCHIGEPIILLYTRSNEEQVKGFVTKLINQSKEYIINKYGKVDKELPIEGQLNNISYLRNLDLIDDVKFEELKQIILGKKGDKSSVGFK